MSNSENDHLIMYKLQPVPDGVKVTVSQAHREFLRYLGLHGGEIRIDWESAERQRSTPPHLRKETIKQHMRKLVEMRLLDEIPIVGTSHSFLRLTDMGRNILTQIIASES